MQAGVGAPATICTFQPPDATVQKIRDGVAAVLGNGVFLPEGTKKVEDAKKAALTKYSDGTWAAINVDFEANTIRERQVRCVVGGGGPLSTPFHVTPHARRPTPVHSLAGRLPAALHAVLPGGQPVLPVQVCVRAGRGQ